MPQVPRIWGPGRDAAPQIPCLILACGNTLRGDDGVGPWLCAWAEDRFRAEPAVRCISRQQWTPDLARDVAESNAVIFIDCSVESAPGVVRLSEISPAASTQQPATHHVSACDLLALARELYGAVPHNALQLTIGAASVELGEQFSPEVQAALPEARGSLELTVMELLAKINARNLPA